MFTSEIFGPDLLIVLVVPMVLLAFVGLSIGRLSTCHRTRSETSMKRLFEGAWIIVIAIFTFFYGFGCFIAIYYLIRVRPKFARLRPVQLIHTAKKAANRQLSSCVGRPIAAKTASCVVHTISFWD